VSVNHYENFPVASWLCPANLRSAVVAIYGFARTADDLADEGTASAEQRLHDLDHYRDEFDRCIAGERVPSRWPSVFEPLRVEIQSHRLALAPFHDLLSAFEQDVRNPSYTDRSMLLDYCRRSANPVGRLLLSLYRINDAKAHEESDAICTALQLINFWQDLGVDVARGRHYVPAPDAARHGVTRSMLEARVDTPHTRALVRDLSQWAETLMRRGAPLVHRIPGRAGWELRLVVQGGLRVLEKMSRMNHSTLTRRPTLDVLDGPPMLWRAVRMRPCTRTAERVA
jgi:squalene synthase HpnC